MAEWVNLDHFREVKPVSERIFSLLKLTVSSADVPVDAITVDVIQFELEAKGGGRKWS